MVVVIKGFCVQVDKEDLHIVDSGGWCREGCRNPKNVYFHKHNGMRLHRVIAGAKPGEYVDHIDGDTLNNTKVNLRICTNSQNLMNRGKTKKNTSGYKGVTYDKKKRKWVALIMKDYHQHFVGYFDDPYSAYLARKEKLATFHGPFANAG